MYFQLVEEGLIANPKFLSSAKHWKNPSLLGELRKRRVSMRKIDSIFRKHHVECHVVSEWIAARDTMKRIKKGITLKLDGDVVKIIPKELRKAIEKVIEGIQGLERIERDLNNQVVKSFGPKGIRKLTRKDIKKWPVFTTIMTDLYNYLIPCYKTKCYYYEVRGWSSREKYPASVFKVIDALLKEYYPTYFKEFSPNAVKTRIKYPPQK
jgi:hypothetical protein